MAERELLDQEWARLKKAKESFEEEKQAFAKQKEEWEQRKALAGQAPKSQDGIFKIFVGNLSPNTDESRVMDMFKVYGEINEVYIFRDHDGKSKRSAFIKFSTQEGAEKAIITVNDKIRDEGQSLAMVARYARKKVDKAQTYPPQPYGAPAYGAPPPYGQPSPYGAPRPAAPAYNPYGAPASAPSSGYPSYAGASAGGGGGMRGPAGANLYINNLDASMLTEQNFRKLFSEFGNVVSAKVFPQGYGFVSYDNVPSAQAAIQGLNGMVSPDGTKRLEVKLKTASTKRRFGAAATAATPALPPAGGYGPPPAVPTYGHNARYAPY